MKYTLKLLLILSIVLAGTYAATPLWLPYILARQLPTGWQLENLDLAYPGLSGINIDVLQVKGVFQTTAIVLGAVDIRIDYPSFKTNVGSLTLDLFEQSTPADSFTLDDLSLPTVSLPGKLPELSVDQLSVALHPVANSKTGNLAAARPLVLNFESFNIIPSSNSSLRLTGNMRFEEFPLVAGAVELEVDNNLLKANIRFPAAAAATPWLLAQIEQDDRGASISTRIQAVLNAESANQEWLDAIFLRGSSGVLTHVGGKLEILADFSGRNLQDIENLSLTGAEFLLESGEGTLTLDTELLATREAETIFLRLPVPARIEYRDKTERLDKLLTNVIPGFQRTARQKANIFTVIDSNSHFKLQTGTNPSAEFNGDIDIRLTSSGMNFTAQANDLKVSISDFSALESTTANGLVTLDWQEHAAFAYKSESMDLKADKLLISSTGNLNINHDLVEFKQTGNFKAELENLWTKLQTGQSLGTDHYAMQGRLDINLAMSAPGRPVSFYFDGPVYATNPVISLPGDEQSPPLTITANELDVTAKLTSGDNELVSTGHGTLRDSHIEMPPISATSIAFTWQELDLVNLEGKLDTRTQGFATEFEGETWTGFDFDVNYSLLSNADVSGSGSLKFDNGPELPIEFAGNTEVERWAITLPGSIVKPAQVAPLLRAAHVELPSSVELTDGYIGLKGDIAINDEIAARMVIEGHELGISMLESNASKTSFRINTSYGNTVSADGPVLIETMALAGGIDVSNIGLDLNLEDAGTYGLQNLRAEVFDGQVNLASLRFSDNRIEDTRVELMGMNLERLLVFVDIDGLTGTGLLNFSLPVGGDQSGIYVKNGTFSSTDPGHLAYTNQGVVASNVGLQALENFHYQDLSGTLDYQSDGAYKMAIRLEGANPDLYDGHLIVFNLNISGSLPELFEALFITGNFEESILKQIGIE